jgi:hypothetical protein
MTLDNYINLTLQSIIPMLQALNSVWKATEVHLRTKDKKDSPQARCFKADPKAKLFIACQITPKNNGYLSFKSVKGFCGKYVKKLAYTPGARLFEILRAYMAVKLYIDFDCVPTDEIQNEATIISKANKALTKLMKDHLDHDFNPHDLRLTKSSKKGKLSIHLTYNSKYRFRTVAEHSAFIKMPEVREALEPLGADFGVYTKNRLMRIIGSTKAGEKRYLTPIGIDGQNLSKDMTASEMAEYLISEASKKKDLKYFKSCEVKPKSPKKAKVKPKEAKEPAEPANPAEQAEAKVKKALDLYYKTENSKYFEKKPREIKYKDGGFIEISMKRIESSFCGICDRTHDNDNTDNLFVTDEGKVFQCCYKATKDNKENPWLFLGNVNHDTDVEEVPLIQKTIETTIARDLVKVLKDKLWSFKKVGSNVIQYEKKYCSQEPALVQSKASITASRGRMGTGKTNAHADWLNEYIIKMPKSRNVLLSFRISASEQAKNEKYVKIPNIVSYRDMDEETKQRIQLNNKIKNLIIQVESLYKINWKKGKRKRIVDTLTLDEVGQLIRQLTSKTFRKQPNARRSWEMFCMLVREAKHIHIMDANLKAAHVKFIKDIRDADEIENISVFWNTYNNFEGREICLLDSEIDLLRLMKQKIDENKKIYLASNGGIEKMEAYREMLKVKGKNSEKSSEVKILLICRETLGQCEVKDALSDPNGTWGNYDAVICSPTVQSAVSFDIPDTFDTIFGMFRNHTSTSEDCGQMLNRVRHPMNPTSYISIFQSNHNIGARTASGVVSMLRANNDHTTGLNREMEKLVSFKIDDQGFNTYTNSPYFKLYANNVIEVNKNHSYFLSEFCRQHHADGYKLTAFDWKTYTGFPEKTNENRATIHKTYRKAIKVVREALRNKNAKAISEAVSITKKKLEEITATMRKGQELTEAETRERDKALILDTYDLIQNEPDLPAEELAEWFKTYGNPKTRKTFKQQQRVFSRHTFEIVLKELKKMEQNYEKKLIKRAKGDATVRTMDLINTNNRYIKWSLLLGWIQDLGFTSLDPKKSPSISKKDILPKVKTIHSGIQGNPAKIVNVLRKPAWKVENVTTADPEHEGYLKYMLQFINGSIRDEFGVSVGRTGKSKEDPYKLKNRFLTKEIFSLGENTKNLPDLMTFKEPEETGVLQELTAWIRRNQADSYKDDEDPITNAQLIEIKMSRGMTRQEAEEEVNYLFSDDEDE